MKQVVEVKAAIYLSEGGDKNLLDFCTQCQRAFCRWQSSWLKAMLRVFGTRLSENVLKMHEGEGFVLASTIYKVRIFYEKISNRREQTAER